MSGSSEKTCRIAIVAPGRSIDCALADESRAVVARVFGDAVQLDFHPQCFLTDGHFAGDDDVRLAALVEVANAPDYDAVWFARGGYGACRIAETAIGRMDGAARNKRWLGYSDMGFLLAGLDRAEMGRIAHGPMPIDLSREGGEPAFLRGLEWLRGRDAAERGRTAPVIALNLTVLGNLLGTGLEPDFAGRELWIEDVGEYMYRIDRALFHVTSSAAVKRCNGIRLGRFSDVPANDPDFNRTDEQVVRYWCERSGIPYLGRADIGHDVNNTVVPFS